MQKECHWTISVNIFACTDTFGHGFHSSMYIICGEFLNPDLLHL